MKLLELLASIHSSIVCRRGHVWHVSHWRELPENREVRRWVCGRCGRMESIAKFGEDGSIIEPRAFAGWLK